MKYTSLDDITEAYKQWQEKHKDKASPQSKEDIKRFLFEKSPYNPLFYVKLDNIPRILGPETGKSVSCRVFYGLELNLSKLQDNLSSDAQPINNQQIFIDYWKILRKIFDKHNEIIQKMYTHRK